MYPADPSTVDEVVAVMRQTPPDRHGLLPSFIVGVFEESVKNFAYVSKWSIFFEASAGRFVMKGRASGWSTAVLPLMSNVTFAVEEPQSFFNYRRNIRPPQQAFTHACIQPLLELFGEPLVIG